MRGGRKYDEKISSKVNSHKIGNAIVTFFPGGDGMIKTRSFFREWRQLHGFIA